MICPKCQSKNIASRGKYIHCNNCGKSTNTRANTATIPCPACNGHNTQRRGKGEIYCKDCRHYYPADKPPQGENAQIEYGDTYINVISASRRIHSIEDVIREFKIDTSQWQVDKVRTRTSEGYRKDRSVQWQVDDGRVTRGSVNDSGKMLVVPLFHMEVRFIRKTTEIRARLAIEDLIADAKRQMTPKPLRIKPPRGGLCLEVDFPDLHFGKLTWAEESGENYDIKIASELVRAAVASLIGYACHHKIERVLLPLGNDFFNVDNKDNTTTHGTPQQEDTRYQKTFRMGRQLAIEIIEGLAQIAPVDVLIIPGNHDETRMFFLGDLLEVKYFKDKNVTVNNSAQKRKYYTFGNNLLGLTHGYHEKYEKLSFIMATEQPDLWAKTQHREWHLGDKHHRKDLLYGAEDINGITIRLLRSLSATDAWHFDKGFVGSPRGAEAFLWHPQDGLVAQYHTTVKK